MLRVVLGLSSRGRWRTVLWAGALLKAEKNAHVALVFVCCWLQRWVLIKRDHPEVPVFSEFFFGIYATTYGDEDESQNFGAAVSW